jgi:hypothetical protein
VPENLKNFITIQPKRNQLSLFRTWNTIRIKRLVGNYCDEVIPSEDGLFSIENLELLLENIKKGL